MEILFTYSYVPRTLLNSAYTSNMYVLLIVESKKTDLLKKVSYTK